MPKKGGDAEGRIKNHNFVGLKIKFKGWLK